MKKTKKMILPLVSMLVMSILLSACGGGDNASSGENGSSGSGKVTLSFMHWRGEDSEALNKAIDAFEEENPNIQVEMQTLPSDQYQSTVLSS